MLPRGVLVTNNGKIENSSVRGSGIIFNNGWVLTHGSILATLLNESNMKSWLQHFLQFIPNKTESSKIVNQKIDFTIFESSATYSAQLIYAWRCPLVAHSISNLLASWSLGDTQSKDDTNTDIVKSLTSVFLLLRISSLTKYTEVLPSLDIDDCKPIRGQEVIIEATPYGSEIFLNSISRGIICNVFGDDQCLFLTDARSVTCCEGGPIFTAASNERRVLFGIVASSISWSRGEWVGFTLGVSLSPVLKQLMKQPFLYKKQEKISNYPHLDLIDECIVLIRCGVLWGTGIVIDGNSGLIITCSHVLSHSKEEPVWVVHKSKRHPAQLIYKTPEGLAFDMAVIKTNQHSFTTQLEMSGELPTIGDTVYAAGFPLLSDREDEALSPTLSQGCVSLSNSAMLQTTCCIQSGASGGAILSNGTLIGLVVSNARDSNSGVLYPHVNFSIPSTVFKQHLNNYIKTGDDRHLQSLKSFNSDIQILWKLQKPSSKL